MVLRSGRLGRVGRLLDRRDREGARVFFLAQLFGGHAIAPVVERVRAS